MNIPKEYIGKEIEIIVFAKDEGIAEEKGTKKQVTFNALSIDTRGLTFNRDEISEHRSQ